MFRYGCLLLTTAVLFIGFSSGRRHSPRRVLGGIPVAIEQFPWQAALFSNQKGFLCGASIISQSYALSAAHCFDHRKQGEIYAIKYGTAHRMQESFHIRVRHVHLFPNFQSYLFNDIAVVELENPIQFSQFARAISLRATEAQAGEVAVVSGWGRKEDGYESVLLRAARIRVVDREVCNRYWGPQLTEDKICAAERTRGHCRGDSGGPLVIGQSQVGIVSYKQLDCGLKNMPDVYANVAYFRDFINEKTQNTVQWVA